MPLEIGELLDDRYRIEAILGRGGFGAVYLAQDQRLGIRCAVKENLNLSPESERQFKREATLLATLRHPNLPRVTHHFILRDHQYLVMDYVEGMDLQEYLQHEGEPSEEQVVNWANQIASALSYLHSYDPPIIHRDVKPANIKINPEGRAVLVDFGIAKMAADGQTTSPGARGVTPGFAPPEQYGLERTDARSDIYALGATLYTLLTGVVPPDSVERLIGVAHLTPPDQIRPELSPHISRALMTAVAPRRENRFETIEDFIQAIEEPGIRTTSELIERIPRPAVNRLQSDEEQPAGESSEAVEKAWVLSGISISLLFLVMVLISIQPGLRANLASALGLVARSPTTASAFVRDTTPELETSPTSTKPNATSSPRPSSTLRPTATPTAPAMPIAADDVHTWRLIASWTVEETHAPVAVSKDGRRAAVLQGQGVDIVDVFSGRTIKSLQGFILDQKPTRMVFLEDSLLIQFRDYILRWSISTNNLVKRYDIPGRHLATSRDDRWMAVRDKFVSIFNIQTGDVVDIVGGENSDQHFAISPDGTFFALTQGNTVELYDLSKRAMVRVLTGHGEPTAGLEFSADEERLVSASGDVWHVAGGDLMGVFDSPVDKVTLSPDARLIFGEDGRIWDVQTGERIGAIPIGETSSRVLMVTPDNRFLIRQSFTGKMEIWATEPGGQTATLPESGSSLEVERETITPLNISRLDLIGHIDAGQPASIALDPSGMFLSAWHLRTLRVYRISDGHEVTSFHPGGNIRDVDFINSDQLLVLLTSGRVERWEISTLSKMQEYGVGGDVLGVSPTGDVFAARDVYIQVVDVVSGKIIHRLGTKEAGQDFIFTSDGKHLVISTGAGFGLWDLQTGRHAAQVGGHGPSVYGFALSSRTGRLLASSGDVWDVESGGLIAHFEATAPSHAISPDGQLIFGIDGTVWAAETGQYLGRVDASCEQAAFAVEGTLLILRTDQDEISLYGIHPQKPLAVKTPASAADEELVAWDAAHAPEATLLGWWGDAPHLEVRYIQDQYDPRMQVFSAQTYRDCTPHPENELIACLSGDGVDRINPRDGATLASYEIFLNPNDIQEIEFLGEELLVLKEQAGIEQWDLAGLSMVQRYPIWGSQLTVSPQQDSFFLLRGNHIEVYDSDSGDLLHKIHTSGGYQAACYLPDGRRLAVVDGVLVRIWDLDGRDSITTLRSHAPTAYGLAVANRGDLLIAASGDIWDLEANERISTFTSQGDRLAVHPGGKLFAMNDGSLRESTSGDRVGTLIDATDRDAQLLFLGDGKRLLARTQSGTIYTWGVYAQSETETSAAGLAGKQVVDAAEMTRLSHLGRGRLRDALWSPDGRFLAVNTTQNAQIFVGEQFQLITSYLDGRALSFNDQNELLLGGSGALQWIDPESHSVLLEYPFEDIYAAAIDPDGAWIALGGDVAANGRYDGLALLPLEGGEPRVFSPGRGLYDRVRTLQFTPDGEYIVASFEDAIYIWERSTMSQVRTPITGNIRPASISPDGALLAYLTDDAIIVEQFLKGGLYRRINADGTPHFPTGIDDPRLEPVDFAFQSDGKLLVFYRMIDRTTGETKASVITWDVHSGEHRVRVPDFLNLSSLTGAYVNWYRNERPQQIPRFVLNPNEGSFCSLTADGVARTWSLLGKRMIGRSGSDYTDLFAVSPDDKLLALPNAQGGIDLFDLQSASRLATVDGDWHPVHATFFSNSALALLSPNGSLSYLRFPLLEAVDTPVALEASEVTLDVLDDWGYVKGDLIAFSTSGLLRSRMALTGGSNRVEVYGLASSAPLHDFGSFPLPRAPVFSPEDRWLAVVRTNQVELLNLQTGSVDHSLIGEGTLVGSVAFSLDGATLASTSGEIWSLHDFELKAKLKSELDALAINWDGSVFVDPTGGLWDGQTGNPLGALDGVREPAVNFSFTSDGRQLIWQPVGGIVEIWGIEP